MLQNSRSISVIVGLLNIAPKTLEHKVAEQVPRCSGGVRVSNPQFCDWGFDALTLPLHLETRDTINWKYNKFALIGANGPMSQLFEPIVT